jgi:nitrate/TMAO reductase-like tetraheme cytochrome c subunit
MKSFLTILAIAWLTVVGRNNSPDKALKAVYLTHPVKQDTHEKARYIYVGAAKCASSCHNTDSLGHQYVAWKNSPHARSWKSLSEGKAIGYARKAGLNGDPAQSTVCLKCHITAAEADTASIGNTYRKEDGVTCEACHKREFNPVTYIPVESDCLECHNGSVHKVPNFDFPSYSRKISHPRPATERK